MPCQHALLGAKLLTFLHFLHSYISTTQTSNLLLLTLLPNTQPHPIIINQIPPQLRRKQHPSHSQQPQRNPPTRTLIRQGILPLQQRPTPLIPPEPCAARDSNIGSHGMSDQSLCLRVDGAIRLSDTAGENGEGLSDTRSDGW